MTKDELITALAAIEHERWSDWQRYVHSQCGTVKAVGSARETIGNGGRVIPGYLVTGWERQIATPYAELSHQEQASDIEQVMRYWPLVVQFVSGWMDQFADDNTAALVKQMWREEMA